MQQHAGIRTQLAAVSLFGGLDDSRGVARNRALDRLVPARSLRLPGSEGNFLNYRAQLTRKSAGLRDSGKSSLSRATGRSRFRECSAACGQFEDPALEHFSRDKGENWIRQLMVETSNTCTRMPCSHSPLERCL